MGISVVIIDDHQMLVESLADGLQRGGVDVVGVAHTMEDGIAVVTMHQPHVAIVDFELPDGNGIEVARRIGTSSSRTRILMLTGSVNDTVLRAAIGAGCSGFVTKGKPLAEVLAAVQALSAGESYVPAELLAKLVPRPAPANKLGANLTERELVVLGLVAEGLSNQAIAERLHISLNTARNHVQRILAKLDAHSKLEAVAIAIREGLVDVPPPR